MRTGVLALQGDFAAHLSVLESLGADAVEVRNLADLESVDSLVIPGGESTTILKLLDRFDLRDALRKKIESGIPVFGTCAGAIVLATEVSDGEEPLGLIDMHVTRNAYGRQVESFETDLDVDGLGSVHGVFIRAPVIERVGESVRVLARWADQPVLIQSGRILASTFHPELTGDATLHEYFLKEI